MQQDLLLKSYNYHLPRKNIAQFPADKRDESRLLVFHRQSGNIEHKLFHDIIDFMKPGDLLVLNDTKVFPARLQGRKETGGKTEVFLLEFPSTIAPKKEGQKWFTAKGNALLKSSKRPRPGTRIYFSKSFFCDVIKHLEMGKSLIEIYYPAGCELIETIKQYGQVPLPPYIDRQQGTTDEDLKRYQTVYASSPGAVAAPTAGLHFTESLLDTIRHKGVQIAEITLHVGYGTFAPVRVENISNHAIHEEYLRISGETASLINATKETGGKIWAVGTTTVRALEHSADENNNVTGLDNWCDLYITPGYRFRIVDNLITNFHLPQSSLLFLVSALCGREQLLNCYQEAINCDYRFYSYGDAMVII